MPASIAVIMACHNRKEKTIRCLDALHRQRLPTDVPMHTYLLDDGSTDGTGAAVSKAFPNVTVLRGDGRLYWNGGMRVAFSEALNSGGYDHFLWLNDDTTLFETALQLLLSAYARLADDGRPQSILVGTTQDPGTGVTTYGGVVRVGKLGRPAFALVEPGLTEKPCDTMNGNCVLIPKAVTERLGSMSPSYTHGMGDYDYGLRGQAANIGVWVAPGYIGTCARNSAKGTWRDSTLPTADRLKKMLGPKGLPPREWLHFCRSHTGTLWPVFFASPYVKFFVLSAGRPKR